MDEEERTRKNVLRGTVRHRRVECILTVQAEQDSDGGAARSDLEDLPGVVGVTFNSNTGSFDVVFDPAVVSDDELAVALGYQGFDLISWDAVLPTEGEAAAEIEEPGPSSTLSPRFDGRDLDEIRSIGVEVSFEPGEAIFEAGYRADALFVVLEGEAQVDVGGRFHRLGPGDVFGEMALIAHDRRLATVRAVDVVRAVKVDGDAFRSLAHEQPELEDTLLRTLVVRLREVEQRIDAWRAPREVSTAASV